ncbi:MAG: 30S ribosomal protein S16, partial [Patescibacteria group bacterium]|nr:30S ribosomal protein S16 [Patescibacteria group bacterium]
MLKIRLQRGGKKHAPFYRIVVAEHSNPVSGKFIDRVGYHNPVSQPKELVIDVEKYQEWVKKGAQPSDTVARL